MTGRLLGTSITAFPRECDGKRFIQCLADEILYYVFLLFHYQLFHVVGNEPALYLHVRLNLVT